MLGDPPYTYTGNLSGGGGLASDMIAFFLRAPIRGGRQGFLNFNLDPDLDEIVKTKKVAVTVIVTNVSVTRVTLSPLWFYASSEC